jgi:hypothetical protein
MNKRYKGGFGLQNLERWNEYMLKFVNVNNGEVLDHIDFVEMIWEMAEARYERLTGKLWCNLDSYEQNQCYCIQFEDLINEGWKMFPKEWKLK